MTEAAPPGVRWWVLSAFVAAMAAALPVSLGFAPIALLGLGPWFVCGALMLRGALGHLQGRGAEIRIRGRVILGSVAGFVVPCVLFFGGLALRETSYLKLEARRLEFNSSAWSSSPVYGPAVPGRGGSGLSIEAEDYALRDYVVAKMKAARLPAGVDVAVTIRGDAPSAFFPFWKPIDVKHEGEMVIHGPRRAFVSTTPAQRQKKGEPAPPDREPALQGDQDEVIRCTIRFHGELHGTMIGLSSRRGVLDRTAKPAVDQVLGILAKRLTG